MTFTRITTAAAILTTLTAFGASAETFRADVWADNWFSMSVNGTQVAEDSVSITTERSFNAEQFTFEATRPFVIGVTAKDFKENDSGLEYIGTGRQQMGDGGIIFQIKDASGEIVSVSDASWSCLVTHVAPLEKSCESEANPVAGSGACAFDITDAPTGWNTTDFDASDWQGATEWSERDVSPKDGYDRVTWDANAQLIWGPDLETDNTVLCRAVIE
ncbi:MULTISPECIES: PEBP family protein [Pacificibacter]|uniref:PEBP family protein n=1 Tax=Pacificibacter TaxID=1042323 RepID=UPI001C0A5049|nr:MULTISPECIES: PEBP family protein [Pacificibacter]MBU2935937.1 PEBP family protein [Pacificibacter marinus]MDO6614432.1 PEBP family protein [Pacificibacter sp. 1_MG-2023]